MTATGTPFSPRELEFVQLLADGLTRRQAHVKLGFGRTRADNIVKIVRIKAGADTIGQAIAWAAANGYVTVTPAVVEVTA